jgi:DNA end-binding protein Ku
MGAPRRANWKGFLRIGEVVCPVALYTAASTSERIAFHTLNRATGHRVRREFIDSATGQPVGKEAQVKGYDLGQGEYVVLGPDEIAAALPVSDKTLAVSAFIDEGDIDDIYFDKPYYLTPADKAAEDAFVLIRDGLRKTRVAAIAQTVLFRRARTVLIRPQASGLIATTLSFDYEVRSADEAFDAIPDLTIKGEMLDLAKHIITTKTGTFDPAAFDDRYEAALADLVKTKLAGGKIEVRKPRAAEKVIDLMAALRESAGQRGKASPRQRTAAKAGTRRKAAKAAPRRKAS